jgi:hypothetical protein
LVRGVRAWNLVVGAVQPTQSLASGSSSLELAKHSGHGRRRRRFRVESFRQRFSSQPGLDHADVQIAPPPEPGMAEPRHQACGRVRHQLGECRVGRSDGGLLLPCDEQRRARRVAFCPGGRSGEALHVRAPERPGRNRAELDAELAKPDQAQKSGRRPGIDDRRSRRRTRTSRSPHPPHTRRPRAPSITARSTRSGWHSSIANTTEPRYERPTTCARWDGTRRPSGPPP